MQWDIKHRGVGAHTYMTEPRDRSSRAIANLKNCRCTTHKDPEGIARHMNTGQPVVAGKRVTVTLSVQAPMVIEAEVGTVYPGNLVADGTHLHKITQSRDLRCGTAARLSPFPRFGLSVSQVAQDEQSGGDREQQACDGRRQIRQEAAVVPPVMTVAIHPESDRYDAHREAGVGHPPDCRECVPPPSSDTAHPGNPIPHSSPRFFIQDATLAGLSHHSERYGYEPHQVRPVSSVTGSSSLTGQVCGSRRTDHEPWGCSRPDPGQVPRGAGFWMGLGGTGTPLASRAHGWARTYTVSGAFARTTAMVCSSLRQRPRPLVEEYGHGGRAGRSSGGTRRRFQRDRPSRVGSVPSWPAAGPDS